MKQRQNILVSACLLGEPCRYDGKSQPCEAAIALAGEFNLIPVCPEQLGGLPTPRVPSEVRRDRRVIDREGTDRTSSFNAGARATLDIARNHGCARAVLKSKSPSCGVHNIYDGTFSGTVIAGQGITAELLAHAGIVLLDENDLTNG